MNAPLSEIKRIVCEVCGKKFSCSADSDHCWCFDFIIEPAALLEIEKRYGDCLCGNCLREISTNFNGADFTTDKTSL